MSAAALLAELQECGIAPEVTADGQGIAVTAGRLTDTQRQAIRAYKEELIEVIMHSVPTDAPAVTLALRDGGDDERGMCLECRHLRGTGPYRCANFRAAGLHAPDLARAMAHTLQRCHGHAAAPLAMGAHFDAVPPTPENDSAAPQAVGVGKTPGAWRALDRAYLAHHATCQRCKCAGRGYGVRCGVGAQLWRDYCNAFNDGPSFA